MADAESEELWIDAVDQLLKGSEWLGMVRGYVDRNCSMFSSEGLEPGECSHGAYDCFQEFRQMAEKILEGILQELGATPEGFIDALARHAAAPVRGPRDETVKTVISEILLLEDFHRFAAHMRNRNDELEREETGEAPLPAQPVASTPSRNHAPDPNAGDEWRLQVVMAISVKEADSKGNLTNEERSLLHWADAVIAMDEQRRLGYSASSADLAHLQETLDAERFRLDIMAAQTGVRGKAAERAQAAQALGISKRLELLMEQIPDVRRELSRARGMCTSWSRSGTSEERLNPEQFERLFLYVNDFIRSQVELVEHAADIRSYLQVQVPGTEPLVPLMVTWLMLEEEARYLEQQVHYCLANPEEEDDAEAAAQGEGGEWNEYEETGDEDPDAEYPDGLVWNEYYDEDYGAYYYVNSKTEESSWEPPPEGYTPWESWDEENQGEDPGDDMPYDEEEHTHDMPYDEEEYNEKVEHHDVEPYDEAKDFPEPEEKDAEPAEEPWGLTPISPREQALMQEDMEEKAEQDEAKSAEEITSPLHQEAKEAEAPPERGLFDFMKPTAASQLKVRQEAEAKAQQEAEAKAQREAEAKAQREAEVKAQQEAGAKAQQEAEAKAQQELEAKAHREAEAKVQQEAEAKTQTKVQQEAEAKAQQQAEAKAQQEAEAKAQQQAEAKAQQQAEAQAQQEIEAQAQQEIEAKAQQEAVAKAQHLIEAKAQLEIETRIQKDNDPDVNPLLQGTPRSAVAAVYTFPETQTQEIVNIITDLSDRASGSLIKIFVASIGKELSVPSSALNFNLASFDPTARLNPASEAKSPEPQKPGVYVPGMTSLADLPSLNKPKGPPPKWFKQNPSERPEAPKDAPPKSKGSKSSKGSKGESKRSGKPGKPKKPSARKIAQELLLSAENETVTSPLHQDPGSSTGPAVTDQKPSARELAKELLLNVHNEEVTSPLHQNPSTITSPAPNLQLNISTGGGAETKAESSMRPGTSAAAPPMSDASLEFLLKFARPSPQRPRSAGGRGDQATEDHKNDAPPSGSPGAGSPHRRPVNSPVHAAW